MTLVYSADNDDTQTREVLTVNGPPLVLVPVAAGGPPSGVAGGDLDGTYPNPGVVALEASDGDPIEPTVRRVPYGAIPLNTFLRLVNGEAGPEIVGFPLLFTMHDDTLHFTSPVDASSVQRKNVTVGLADGEFLLAAFITSSIGGADVAISGPTVINPSGPVPVCQVSFDLINPTGAPQAVLGDVGVRLVIGSVPT